MRPYYNFLLGWVWHNFHKPTVYKYLYRPCYGMPVLGVFESIDVAEKEDANFSKKNGERARLIERNFSQGGTYEGLIPLAQSLQNALKRFFVELVVFFFLWGGGGGS